MTGPIDPIDLLRRLVEQKSYSGDEGAAGDVLFEALAGAGLAPRRVKKNVVCERGSGQAGLLFNSHLDTVPASPSWTRDPWKAAIEGDRLFGLGATDAKSSVAAMAAAFAAAPDPGARGRLVLAATTEEETGGVGGPDGCETVLPELMPLAGGIVGEPTRLAICGGQRGLVRIWLHASGKAGHASRPWEGVNAIERAAEDILALRTLAASIGEAGADPLTGRPTIQATVINGGTAPNVIPDACQIVLDVRTTRAFDNDTAIARISGVVQGRVEVRSRRFRPVATGLESPLVRAARSVLPDAPVEPFGGVSDLFFLATAPGGAIPSILLGPGDGKQSHKPDEFVAIPSVLQAAEAYRGIAERFWSNDETREMR